jgi:hypothetical protein
VLTWGVGGLVWRTGCEGMKQNTNEEPNVGGQPLPASALSKRNKRFALVEKVINLSLDYGIAHDPPTARATIPE